uniref:Uncharacterized protein n=1 Tax=Salix viminalis TaxID=40686 RepID=A0A6N2KIP9_SALVM
MFYTLGLKLGLQIQKYLGWAILTTHFLSAEGSFVLALTIDRNIWRLVAVLLIQGNVSIIELSPYDILSRSPPNLQGSYSF